MREQIMIDYLLIFGLEDLINDVIIFIYVVEELGFQINILIRNMLGGKKVYQVVFIEKNVIEILGKGRVGEKIVRGRERVERGREDREENEREVRGGERRRGFERGGEVF